MTPTRKRILDALDLLRRPVPREKQHLMRRRWEAPDPRWRTATQAFGRQITGCGATLAIHPRWPSR